MNSRPINIAGAWLALVLLLAGMSGARAEALSIAVGEGKLVTLEQDAQAVFVANPEIADVQISSGRSVFVLGRRTGTTSLVVNNANTGYTREHKIVVAHNILELNTVLRMRFPNLRLTLESAPGSVMVSGQVKDASTADAVMQTLQAYLGEEETIINALTMDAPTQVFLRVRVTEVSREVTQQLGINWQAIGTFGNVVGGLFSGRAIATAATALLAPGQGYSVLGGYSNSDVSVNGLVDLLDQEGLVTVLAEPNLTAVTGETASFLAGGEFPVPVDQDNDGITIEFKSFGVALDFTPTVLSDDRISLKVRPEISELSPTNSVRINGLEIPGLSVRRVETTVEIGSGESFAIGGLLQNSTRDIVSKFPYIGDVPVLGALFTSTEYQNNKSELIVIVTPYLVRPTAATSMNTPDQFLRPAGDIEYILQSRTGADPLAGDMPRLLGNAGFVY